MKQNFDMNNFSLTNKIALVTGASYGIGYAIASSFANAGATIVFNDINQELVDKGLAAYQNDGIQAYGYVCDVTDETAVANMIKDIEANIGTIDILVNNAGIIKRTPMCKMSADEFRKVIDIDLNGPFIVSKAVIPSMIKKGHGKIINISASGITVEVNNIVGHVKIFNVKGDLYQFDPESYIVKGRKHKQTFKIGDNVRIKVLEASKELRTIDFEICEKLEKQKTLRLTS